MTPARLLDGLGDDAMTLRRHQEVHGPLEPLPPSGLRHELAASGLLGRGGGAFPLTRKLDAAARGRRRPLLIANGREGEPMSHKDRALMRHVPHLVLDGALATASTIGADRVTLAVDELDLLSAERLGEALNERDPPAGGVELSITPVPGGYVAGQETALVNWLNRGGTTPTLAPPRVTERGVDGRPTVVSNVETLAHVALIARHGAHWFRECGSEEHPGTTLISLSGAVRRPGVYEIPIGLPLADLMRTAGGLSEAAGGLLIGGYAGSWIGPDAARGLRLDPSDLRGVGARLGAGIVVVLPASACPVAETSRLASWMALESAGQCGPCVHGLAAVAGALQDIRSGHDGRRAIADVARWCAEIPGRGACAHPDGAVAVIGSALRVFAADFTDHAEHGPCDACDAPPVLTVPTFSISRRR